MLAGGAVAAVMLVGAVQDGVGDDSVVIPGVMLAKTPVGGMDAAQLASTAATLGVESAARSVTLVGPGGVEVETAIGALGAEPAPEAAIATALAIGRGGNPLRDLVDRVRARRGQVDIPIGQRFREQTALAYLQDIAPRFERPSLPTRFDFESEPRRVLPAALGSTLLPHDTLSSVAVGLAAGHERIEVVTVPAPPAEDPLAAWADTLDVSVVLGRFSTPYSLEATAQDRAHNLKIGAARLDGFVLQPGATFSFNEVVGPRTTDAGFRYAPGITSGEIVDVVGGGICQMSSTLFGAAFFAGLEIEHARPHSRPSSYVDMGLDSTVVDGAVDMKLRNAFDFPVVFHVAVRSGEVEVELLGPRRPYRVAFERTVDEVLPYATIVRNDARLRAGTQAIAQRGKRGFKVTRRRVRYQGATEVDTQEWTLHYPPTREIVRRGTNPAGQVPEATTLPPLRDPANELRIVQ